MKIYMIDSYTFSTNKNVSIFEYFMFHGEAKATWDLRFSNPKEVYDLIKEDPLRLTRNDYFIPKIFQPSDSLNLVVVESIYHSLKRILPPENFNLAVFEKTYTLKWMKGEQNQIYLPGLVQDLIKKGKTDLISFEFENNIEYGRVFSNYFEILGTPYINAKSGFEPSVKVSLETNPEYENGSDFVLLCDGMFIKHPIIHCGNIFVREDVFLNLKDKLNARYFNIFEFNI